VKPEDYTQAYKAIAGAFDEPAMTCIIAPKPAVLRRVAVAPSTKPFDLFEPTRKGHVKTLCPPVFTRHADLLPAWLRSSARGRQRGFSLISPAKC